MKSSTYLVALNLIDCANGMADKTAQGGQWDKTKSCQASPLRRSEIRQRKPRSGTKSHKWERARTNFLIASPPCQMAKIFRHSHFWSNLFNSNDCSKPCIVIDRAASKMEEEKVWFLKCRKGWKTFFYYKEVNISLIVDVTCNYFLDNM